MELNLRLTHELPEEIIEAFGIDEDTVFSAYFSNGKIVIETVTESDLAEAEIAAEEDYSEGYSDGFYEGYRASRKGEPLPEKYGNAENGEDDPRCPEDCDNCDYCCPNCGGCNIYRQEGDEDNE